MTNFSHASPGREFLDEETYAFTNDSTSESPATVKRRSVIIPHASTFEYTTFLLSQQFVRSILNNQSNSPNP